MTIAMTGFKTWRMREEEARQQAAFFLASGIDLAVALRSSGAERDVHIRNVQRLMERERLKGLRRHWAYDLNRHIALKQALDRLCGEAASGETAARKTAPGGAAIARRRN